MARSAVEPAQAEPPGLGGTQDIFCICNVKRYRNSLQWLLVRGLIVGSGFAASMFLVSAAFTSSFAQTAAGIDQTSMTSTPCAVMR
jgi:hypothetical protein